MRLKTALFFLILPFHFLYSQDFPQDYFQSPLDIPLYLSGNFGELRSNHFHAGLDIKTEGVSGKKVFAVAEGYVSRIKVSPFGYGLALYVTHPNGYTSVYGHLSKYADKIAAYVKENQYRKESYSIQLFPPPFSIPVTKGEIIAYSGNSGGSGGPHLHFEIRDTKTEHPYNPLFFGFDIADNLAPDIYAISLFPLNDTSLINGSNKVKRYTASGKNGKYYLDGNPKILAKGKIGIGIEAVDRMSGTGNSYGLFEIDLYLNNALVFKQKLDEFAFHEGRYINAHIDYETYFRRRRRIQKSFILDGNKLRIYKVKDFSKGFDINNGTYTFKYDAIDFHGNSSELEFEIEAYPFPDYKKEEVLKEKPSAFFAFDERNTFLQDKLLLIIPANTLYEDIYFDYREEKALPGTLSPVYWLHRPETPLHSYMTVSIKVPNLTNEQKKKAIIYSTVDGKSKYAEGGKWNGDNISVKTRSFGGYGLALDTVAPKIRALNIYPGANLSSKWSIQFKINDDFSGIEYYRAEVDGKWILMEYDAKNDLLTYFFDEKVGPGKHEIILIVKDGVGNTAEYKAQFTR